MEIEILKNILDNHGSVVTTDLLYDLGNPSTLSEIFCNDERFVTCLYNGTPKVVVRSPVPVCWRKGCEGCEGLHLCKGFLLTGSCQFSLTRRGCIFSHNLLSEHNERILKKFGLQTLSRAQLCVLLLQSNNNLLPPICYNYNNRSGCQDSCQRLHICQRFFSQDCSCFRTHDFLAPQPFKLLQDRRIPESLIESLKFAYANKEALRYADRSDSRRNKRDGDSNGDLHEQQSASCGFESDGSQGALNAGYGTESSSDVRTNQGRGVQGRRGNFRGRRGQHTSSRGGAGSMSSNFMSNPSSQVPLNTSDMLDDGLEISKSISSKASQNNRGGHGGFGKGSSTASRGRGGTSKSDGVSQNDLLAATKEASVTNPKTSNDKRQSHGQRDKTEICMYFIKGHCKHEDRCFKAHDKMPYRWEIKQDGQWTHMTENEKIEQAYCDPANAYSTTSRLVYFDIMKCEDKEVRRLSTINSVQEPDFIHTTDWFWFWEDDHGQWLQYGAHSAHGMASITSKQLEEMYLKNNKDVVQFKAGSQSYELSFQDMIQTNIKYGTKRIVRRRPRFVSAAEVQTKRKRPANTAVFPEYWDKTQIFPTGHRRIDLQSSLCEYKEIHDLFCQTMKGFDILKIERIQNKAVWEAFQLHKTQLKDKNNGQQVTEKKLFHGTDASLVDTICATSFDWRVCGVNGTAYGQGSYFARDAKYSHNYTGTSDIRFMFVSRVLVGEYTKGRSEYRRPPSKDGGNVNLYDSCVDDIMNPSIFVVFEKQQIYPEYVLQYQRTNYQQPVTFTTVSRTPVAAAASSSSAIYANATNPTTPSSTSSSNAVKSNFATTRPSISPSFSATQSSTVSSANLTVNSSAFSSNVSVTNPSNRLSSSSTAFASTPTPALTTLSNSPKAYPQRPTYSSSNLATNLTSASSNPYVAHSRTYTSDSSFRFTNSTPQITPSTTRETTTFSTSSPTKKKENNCVIT